MADAIASGKRLKDRYRLERTLGRGGMAAVWLGHDELLDRPVAVKVLSDTIASDPGFVARFRREARTAAALSHPNLVGVYDFSEEGERPYLVMEFVPGRDLASRLRHAEPVDRDKLARELLDALAHIHQFGILHRDIKPANIIIDPDGTAKLIDFGIALPPDATSLTHTGLVLGTERYAAPEVLEGRPATERSDLYSAGMVLRSGGGRSSPALEELIGAMISRNPRDRPLSAGHALERLERPAAVEEPTVAFELSSTQPTERLPRTGDGAPPVHALSSAGSGRGTRTAGLLGVLGLLGVAIVLALVALSGDGDSQEGGGRQTAQAKSGKDKKTPAREAEQSSPPAAGEAASPPKPSGTNPTAGAALNEQGFAMIQAGEYEAAVPVLEEAVESFPEGTEDLDYAYALFNLGNALRLSGRPEDAIPVLEQRLRIPNQEPEVREELEAAYADAGERTSPTDSD